MKVLPWILAGAFAIATVILGLRSPGAAKGVPAKVPKEPAPAETVAAPDLALRRCNVRLEIVAGELADVRSGAPGRCEAGVEAEVARRLEAAAEARAMERDGDREAIRGMVQEFLAITPEQSAWLLDYVCAVRGMRADVLAEIKEHKIGFEEAAKRQKSERQDALDDLKNMLGEEKYQQLRGVGGLGKLGDLFGC
jgi:hypothetical protein